MNSSAPSPGVLLLCVQEHCRTTGATTRALPAPLHRSPRGAGTCGLRRRVLSRRTGAVEYNGAGIFDFSVYSWGEVPWDLVTPHAHKQVEGRHGGMLATLGTLRKIPADFPEVPPDMLTTKG